MPSFNEGQVLNPPHYCPKQILFSLKKYKMKYYSLIVIIVMVAISCNQVESKIAATTDPKPAPSYQLATVKQGAIGSAITLPAQLIAFEAVQLYPKVNGFVKEVL